MAEDRENSIRDRAYRIWQDEGEPQGRDQAHWAKAEQEHGNDETGSSQAYGSEPDSSSPGDDGLISDISDDLPFGEPADTRTADEAPAGDTAPEQPQTIAAEPSESDAGESAPAAIESPAAAPLGKKQLRGKARTKTTN